MNENIVRFLKKFAEQPDLQEKMKTITDPDEAYALASSVQDGFTKEEFVEAMTKIKEKLDGQELSDEDLAKTAGGEYLSDTEKYVIMGGGILFTAGGVAAAIMAS